MARPSSKRLASPTPVHAHESGGYARVGAHPASPGARSPGSGDISDPLDAWTLQLAPWLRPAGDRVGRTLHTAALRGRAPDLVLRPCPDARTPSRAGGGPRATSIAALAAWAAPGALVVGDLFGARLALGLLAQDAVAGAILVGVNPGLAEPAARAARRVRRRPAWAARLRALGTAGFLDEWEAQPLFASQVRAPLARRERRRAERAQLAPEPLAQALEHLGLGAMPDSTLALTARATAPT